MNGIHTMKRFARTPLVVLLFSLGAIAGCSSTPHYPTVFAPKPLTHTLGSTDDLRIAAGALESGDVQLAGSLYEKALRADPKSVEANLGIGDCLFQTGDLERARIAYARAAALAPEAPAPKLALARVAVKQRHFDDATRLYHALLARTPDDPAASAGLGTVLDLTGHHDEAQALYRSALAHHPESQALRIDLGLSLTLAGKPREGVNVLLDVASIGDAPPQARQDLALAYGLLGNDEAAEKILLVDLPKNSVQDNLRYYARVRAAIRSKAAASETTRPAESPASATTSAVRTDEVRVVKADREATGKCRDKSQCG
jgi:Flp pilus assembly protein TadD